MKKRVFWCFQWTVCSGCFWSWSPAPSSSLRSPSSSSSSPSSTGSCWTSSRGITSFEKKVPSYGHFRNGQKWPKKSSRRYLNGNSALFQMTWSLCSNSNYKPRAAKSKSKKCCVFSWKSAKLFGLFILATYFANFS